MNKFLLYFYVGLGVLVGIVIVSTIRHGELSWLHISRPISLTVLGFISILLIRVGVRRSRN